MTSIEQVLIRTNGGPNPGNYVVPVGRYGWPLPDTLTGNGTKPGVYRKVRESILSPLRADSHVMRGAEYEWEAAS